MTDQREQWRDRLAAWGQNELRAHGTRNLLADWARRELRRRGLMMTVHGNITRAPIRRGEGSSRAVSAAGG
jgi:hypothetical protein